MSHPDSTPGNDPKERDPIRRTDAPHELHLDLPATHAHGRMGRQIARQFAEAEGVPESDCDTFEFVVGELLDNAIDHGGGDAARDLEDLPREGVRMSLVAQVLEGRWLVRVGDQGGGNPDELRPLLDPPDGIPDLDDERGRGFFLLAQMVDRLEVEATDDGLGLSFQATKSFDPPAADPRD